MGQTRVRCNLIAWSSKRPRLQCKHYLHNRMITKLKELKKFVVVCYQIHEEKNVDICLSEATKTQRLLELQLEEAIPNNSILLIYQTNKRIKPVIWSKIMAPLRSTVNFIDCKQSNSTTLCRALGGFYESERKGKNKKRTLICQTTANTILEVQFKRLTCTLPQNCLRAYINDAIYACHCFLLNTLISLTRPKEASRNTMFC